MNEPPSLARNLAFRLLAHEAARQADGEAQAVTLVIEKLRRALARFAGPDGFASLLRRALALARREVPALQEVTAGRDGTLAGLERVSSSDGKRHGEREAGSAIVVHLLGLMVAFVGEPITLQLVRDAWPDAALSDHMDGSGKVP